MWTFRLGPEDLDEHARDVARRWWLYVIGGVLLIAVGIVLLLDLYGAIATLALLVAFALALQGIDQFANASKYRPRWVAYVVGGLYLAVAVWAALWPGITLWALAVVAGVGFIVTGIAELVAVFRFHHDLSYRWMFAILGVVSVVTGVLAVLWPGVTILVLAVLLGVRVTIEGVALVAFGIGLFRQLPDHAHAPHPGHTGGGVHPAT